MKFEIFAETCQKLEATSKRLEMLNILADLFREATKEDIGKLCYLLQGQLLPAYEAFDIGMGEKFVEQSIGIATGYSKEEVHSMYKKMGDLGKTAEELIKRKKQAALVKKELTVKDVYNTLMQIAQQTGAGSQARKIKLFAELLSQATPLAARYITRIPIGKLQLGVGDPTVLDALSMAKEGDRSFREPLERAYNLCSDLGLVAERYWEDKKRIEEFEITPFRPIRPALAEREKTVEAIIKRLGKCAAEYKYDGFRLSIHKVADKVEIFSRRLEKMTNMFPEIVDAVKKNIKAKSIIFEGEALAYDEQTGEFQPFQVTIQRKRKYGIEEMAKKMPLHLFCFDLLYLNGKDYTLRPYLERRRTLEKVVVPGPNISMAEVLITDNPDEMKKYLAAGIERGMEGLVVKDLNAPYIAGARKFAWIKLKRSYRKELADTIDAVIVGYLRGRGARAKFKFGALLCAVYDEEKDEFKTIAKVGSGFTEEQMGKMGAALEKIKTQKKPARVDALIEPDVWVNPEYVITIAADEITESPLHTAGRVKETGYALRFPRMVSDGFRLDKKPEDATTVKEILRMYKLQKTVKLK